MVMARHSNHRDLLVAVAVVSAFLAVGDVSGVVFDLHHRSSPVVRRWAEARGHPALAAEWPPQGSPEYYSKLSGHDRALHARRGLAAADGLLTFADGNETIQSLGSLYYAEVALGTPNTTFMVALDTGSDLFWVPCECKQCAQLSGNATAQLQTYTPSLSSTSNTVTCNNSLCGEPSGCTVATNGSCPYTVQYVSANTSSSGVLVEDVLHLTKESPASSAAATEAVNASVVFGCGQVQTGDFLDGAGFDGLMGLGRGKTSVPSELAAAGVVASDSFSMCFSSDGVGRISFGDTGSSGGQSETAFIASPVYYNVSFTSINVGSQSAAAEFAAVVDSGTSYTYLNDPEYTQLATNYNSQIREERANYNSSPFEYCYGLSSNQTEVFLPDVSLTASGGAVFPVTWPIIPVVGEINGQARTVGYCLALLKSDISTNIIGQNFMTGLKVVFNRERSVLGWQKFDCYKNTPVAGGPEASPSPGAAGPSPTKITPQQNDGGNSKPGAAPLPRSAGSLDALGGRLLLLLPLLAAAALV
nr:unnamed protein product [Digitaria exilis]